MPSCVTDTAVFSQKKYGSTLTADVCKLFVFRLVKLSEIRLNVLAETCEVYLVIQRLIHTISIINILCQTIFTTFRNDIANFLNEIRGKRRLFVEKFQNKIPAMLCSFLNPNFKRVSFAR